MSPEADRLQQVLRAVFDDAITKGNLTSLHRWLSVHAESKIGSGAFAFEPEVMWDYLRDRVLQRPPIFLLEERATDLSNFNDPSLQPHPEVLNWLLGIWIRLLPKQIASQAQENRETVLELWHQPLQFQPTDWPLFLAAAQQKFIAPLTEVRPIAEVYSAGVYSMKDATGLMAEMSESAMPFEGPGGRILVYHFNNSRSTKLLAKAEKAVRQKQSRSPADAMLDELLSPQGHRLQKKEVFLTYGDQARLSNTDIAKLWLEEGLIDPVCLTGEDSLASAKRQVQRLRAKQKQRGTDLP